MTRKDFQLIAGIIASFRFGKEDFSLQQRRLIASAFATSLAHTNPRFDHAKFLAACMGGSAMSTVIE